MTERIQFTPIPYGDLTLLGSLVAQGTQGVGDFLLRFGNTNPRIPSDKFQKYAQRITEDLRWLGIKFDEQMPSPEKLKKQCDEILEILLTKDAAYRSPNSKKNDTYRYQPLEIDSASTYVLSKTHGSLIVSILIDSLGEIKKEKMNSRKAEDFILQYPDGSHSYILSSVISFINEEITKIIQGASRELGGNIVSLKQQILLNALREHCEEKLIPFQDPIYVGHKILTCENNVLPYDLEEYKTLRQLREEEEGITPEEVFTKAKEASNKSHDILSRPLS